jgi:SAM-dependent methyltransferase
MDIARKIELKLKKMRHLDYVQGVRSLQSDLKNGFDKFCELKDPIKLKLVQELLGQEGTIDAEMEGYKSTENQRDLSIQFHWGHNHRFNGSLSKKGRMGDRHINLIAEFMTGFDLSRSFFERKSCIDVGSWTGGTTLMLKYLGASRVLAQKYAVTTKKLASEVYELDGVTSEGTNLYELTMNEQYDVAYFPGVIYHLSDPVLGLRRLFNCLSDEGVCLVETAGIDETGSIARFDGNRIYHKTAGERATQLNRGGWNWFIPSPLCLERWMVEAGFEDVCCYYSYASNRVFGYGKRKHYVDICRAGFSVPHIE